MPHRDFITQHVKQELGLVHSKHQMMSATLWVVKRERDIGDLLYKLSATAYPDVWPISNELVQ